MSCVNLLTCFSRQLTSRAVATVDMMANHIPTQKWKLRKSKSRLSQICVSKMSPCARKKTICLENAEILKVQDTHLKQRLLEDEDRSSDPNDNDGLCREKCPDHARNGRYQEGLRHSNQMRCFVGCKKKLVAVYMYA